MKKIVILLSLLLFTCSVYAVDIANPVSIALGDAYIAKARGCHALNWNPANLGIVKNSMTFNLFQVTADVSNNALDLGYYNDIVGKYLTQEEEQEFLDRIPDDGFSLKASADLHLPLSLSIGKFGFAINALVRSSVNLGKDYFDIVLNGNEIGETFNFENNEGSAISFSEFKLGYGDKIPVDKIFGSFADFPSIYGGISIGYINGLAYGEIMDFTTEFSTNDSVMDVHNNLLIRTAGYDTENDEIIAKSVFPGAGSGFRVSLGLTSPITDKITASLAINNLFASINWTEACEEHQITVNDDDFALYDWIENWEEIKDSIVVDTTYTVGDFSTSIPAEIHMGGSYSLNQFTFYGDYVQGFGKSLLTSAKPKFSFGAEYLPLKWLPLRAGFGFGGDEKPHFSFGSGFEFTSFEFSWGVSYYTSPIYTTATGLKVSFGALLAF